MKKYFYVVTRPYCSPCYVGVIASSAREAKSFCNKTYGFASNMTAVRKTEKGVIIAQK